MYLAALERGLGNETHVHRTCDPAQWQVLQLDEQFGAQPRATSCAEVEGRIRHLVRRRLDVRGDWREDNLVLLTALLTIRHSRWWDDFRNWQDAQDRRRFQRRLLGEGLNRYRGPRERRLVHAFA
jgi:hypothetical protein